MKTNWIEFLKTAPKAFWTVTLVQFFCWFAFQYMWTYSVGAIAENVWHTTDASSVGYQEAGNWYGVLAAVQSVAAVICSFVSGFAGLFLWFIVESGVAGEPEHVVGTPRRARLRAVQTPQGFATGTLVAAHRARAERAGDESLAASDDAAQIGRAHV